MFPIKSILKISGAGQVNHYSASRLPFQFPGEVVSKESMFLQPPRHLEGAFLNPPHRHMPVPFVSGCPICSMVLPARSLSIALPSTIITPETGKEWVG